jgi:hypothetical protein
MLQGRFVSGKQCATRSKCSELPGNRKADALGAATNKGMFVA